MTLEKRALAKPSYKHLIVKWNLEICEISGAKLLVCMYLWGPCHGYVELRSHSIGWVSELFIRLHGIDTV